MAGCNVPFLRSPNGYTKCFSSNSPHFVNSEGLFLVSDLRSFAVFFFNYLRNLDFWNSKAEMNFPFLSFVWIITTLRHWVHKILPMAWVGSRVTEQQAIPRKITTSIHQLIFQKYFPSHFMYLLCEMQDILSIKYCFTYTTWKISHKVYYLSQGDAE